jgi:uncharacterized membrane protein YhdT
MITDGQQIVGFPEWFNLLAIIRHGGFLTVTVGLMMFVFLVGWLYLRFGPERSNPLQCICRGGKENRPGGGQLAGQLFQPDQTIR